MKPSEILERAHALISQPGAHTTGDFARDIRGQGCLGHDSQAVCWCAIGAVQKMVGPFEQIEGDEAEGFRSTAITLLGLAAKKVTGDISVGIVTVNDEFPRETLDSVFHTAIAMAREQEAV